MEKPYHSGLGKSHFVGLFRVLGRLGVIVCKGTNRCCKQCDEH